MTSNFKYVIKYLCLFDKIACNSCCWELSIIIIIIGSIHTNNHANIWTTLEHNYCVWTKQQENYTLLFRFQNVFCIIILDFEVANVQNYSTKIYLICSSQNIVSTMWKRDWYTEFMKIVTTWKFVFTPIFVIKIMIHIFLVIYLKWCVTGNLH